MKRPWIFRAAAGIAGAIALASVIHIGTPRAADGIPVVSPRGYIGGSAQVAVNGAFKVNADIPINKQASISDGQMTYLQFGVSGAAEPNMLLTVSQYEIGFGVARGKAIATAGAEDCVGEIVVGEKQITGQYNCKGVTSYDPGTGQMGTVDIEIRFVALS